MQRLSISTKTGDLDRLNGHNYALFHTIVAAFGAKCIKLTEGRPILSTTKM